MKTLHILIFIIGIFSYSNILIAQVGIGTDSPNSIIDIRATDTITPSNTDGILIPRVKALPFDV